MIDFPRLFSVRNEFARQKHILTVTRKFGEALYMVLSYSLSFSRFWAKMHLDEAIGTNFLTECYIIISVLEKVKLVLHPQVTKFRAAI